MSEPEPRTGVDWSEVTVAVLRTGLMLIVVVMADPGLRWEAMRRVDQALRWWNRRREVPSSPPVGAPALTAVLERAREITREVP